MGDTFMPQTERLILTSETTSWLPALCAISLLSTGPSLLDKNWAGDLSHAMRSWLNGKRA